MKKRFGCFALLLVSIIAICRCSAFAQSDYVKDYNLQPHIFNTNNNAVIPNAPNKVYIMYLTTGTVGAESITIQNNSGEPVDVAHWTLGNSWNPKAYLIQQDQTMYQGNTRTFSNPGLGFQIGIPGDKIYLEDQSGAIIDTWSVP